MMGGLLSASTSSQLPSSDMIGRASTIAAKTLGFKPSTGPVKSLQLAAAAAKKVCKPLDGILFG